MVSLEVSQVEGEVLKIDKDTNALSINISAGDGLTDNANKNGLNVNNDGTTIGVQAFLSETGGFTGYI